MYFTSAHSDWDSQSSVMLAVFLLSAPSTVRLHGAASVIGPVWLCGLAERAIDYLNVNEQSSLSAYSLSRSNMLQVDLVPARTWCLLPSASPWSLVSTFTPAGMCGPLRQFSAPGSSNCFYCTVQLNPVTFKPCSTGSGGAGLRDGSRSHLRFDDSERRIVFTPDWCASSPPERSASLLLTYCTVPSIRILKKVVTPRDRMIVPRYMYVL